MDVPTDVSSFITARRRTWTFSRQRGVGTSLEAWQRQTDSFITKLSDRVSSSVSSARTTTTHVISASQEVAHVAVDTSNQSASGKVQHVALSQAEQNLSTSPDSSSPEQSTSVLLTDEEDRADESGSLGLCNDQTSPFKDISASLENQFEVEEILSTSAFADVYKVRIHPLAHFRSNDGDADNDVPKKYAVKRLINSQSMESKREAGALARIVRIEDPAFVQPVARWNSSGDTYFMFPLADGNLRDLLRSQSPAEDQKLFHWALQQMLGITQGLHKIHAAQGRHGDLKPENILLFNDEKEQHPTFKITDFGLTEFSSSGDSKAIGSQLTFTPAYRAPEVDMIDGRLSRKLDIWSLGCILLEIVTWTVVGSEGVARFEDVLHGTDEEATPVQSLDSAFFQAIAAPNIPGPKQPFNFSIKPSVSQWMADLRRHPRASRPVNDVLDLIENHLLVVSAAKRMTAAALAMALLKIYDSPWMDPAVPPDSSVLLADSPARVEELSDAEGTIEDHPQPTLVMNMILKAHNLRLFPPEKIDQKGRMGRLLGQLYGLGLQKYGDHIFAPNRLQKLESMDGWKLSWTYGHKQLCIHLSSAEADLFASHVPVQGQNSSYLPQWMATVNQEQTSTGTSGDSWSPAAVQKALQQIWDRFRWRGAQSVENRGTEKPEDDEEESQGWSETFLTTDKVWSTSKCKVLRRLSPDFLKDDEEFFIQVGAALRGVQGWSIGCFIPWKTYSCAELAKFTVHFRNRDFVHVSPYSPTDGDTPSNFGHGFLGHIQTSETPDPAAPSNTSSAELRVLMAYLGENLCHGLLDPTLGSGDRTVLDGIPKRWCPPPLKMEPKQSGVCFHIAQGLSPQRMIFWGIASLIVGLAFVPFWLCFVDSKDLQNAFVPVTWTISVYVAVAAIVMLEGAM